MNLFLSLKTANKRYIEANDLGDYKIKLLKTLQHSYSKLNLDKMLERDVYKNYYDQTHKTVYFKIGEQVMLFTPRTQIGLSRKFLSRWTGPFKIISKINPVTYRLELHPNAVHVQRLKRYRPWHSINDKNLENNVQVNIATDKNICKEKD